MDPGTFFRLQALWDGKVGTTTPIRLLIFSERVLDEIGGIAKYCLSVYPELVGWAGTERPQRREKVPPEGKYFKIRVWGNKYDPASS